ncbi:MAG TPA: hypothetical protein PLT89_10805 [Syntrophomonadaceae bacterium]|nr:hypothetical protein [Syntrophomonadaceae bacterium]
MTKSADNKRMLYGRIPVTVTGSIDLDATAKILAPKILARYEAEQQALDRRKQLRLIDESKSD